MQVHDSIRPEEFPEINNFIPPEFIQIYKGKQQNNRMIYYSDAPISERFTLVEN
jgi:hypothetical protein